VLSIDRFLLLVFGLFNQTLYLSLVDTGIAFHLSSSNVVIVIQLSFSSFGVIFYPSSSPSQSGETSSLSFANIDIVFHLSLSLNNLDVILRHIFCQPCLTLCITLLSINLSPEEQTIMRNHQIPFHSLVTFIEYTVCTILMLGLSLRAINVCQTCGVVER
jgi:hypothetical protein